MQLGRARSEQSTPDGADAPLAAFAAARTKNRVESVRFVHSHSPVQRRSERVGGEVPHCACAVFDAEVEEAAILAGRILPIALLSCASGVGLEGVRMQAAEFQQECRKRLILEMRGISYKISSEEIETDKAGNLLYRALLQKLNSPHTYDFRCSELDGGLVAFINF